MSNFDEKSGVVHCETPWGRWWQTLDAVNVEIVVPHPPLKGASDVRCTISTKSLSCTIRGCEIINGELFGPVQADESTWTLEGKRVIRIVLTKASIDAANCWTSLLASGAFAPDPFRLDEMRKKLTLERFHTEHPGMDFSGAEITGNYQTGGPRLPV